MKSYRNSGIFRKIYMAKSASFPNIYLLTYKTNVIYIHIQLIQISQDATLAYQNS